MKLELKDEDFYFEASGCEMKGMHMFEMESEFFFSRSEPGLTLCE